MSDTTKVKEELLDHFTHGAPSYKMANEAVKAKAREEAEAILPLIDKYTREARIDELKELQMAPNVSDDAKDENYTGYIKDRIAQLTEQKDGE